MRRLVFVAPAALSLFVALDAGLFRIGWPLPLPQPDLPLAHGPLMVSGFLGTLIGIEKAVALRRGWAYWGPAASGVGGVLLAIFPNAVAPRLAFLGGSVALVIVASSFLLRHPTTANTSVLTGALLWMAGNGFWLAGWPVFAVVPAWVGFLLMTIAGERLELNRLLSPSPASRAAFGLAAIASLAAIALAGSGFHSGGDVVFTGAGMVFSSLRFELGVRLLGASLVALGLWLLFNDMARPALRKPGLTRFMAVSLLLGYAWLVLAGALWLVHGGFVGGPVYDAILHGFFLGFAFSMIFAHGPVIFPSIVGRPLRFRPVFYAPVALLNAGLALRWAGDFIEWGRARPWGGLLNAVAIVLFLATIAFTFVEGRDSAARG